jgi:uncharacterized protein (DUF427 family)
MDDDTETDQRAPHRCACPAARRPAAAARRSLAAMAYKATWNGAVLAESDATVEVEGARRVMGLVVCLRARELQQTSPERSRRSRPKHNAPLAGNQYFPPAAIKKELFTPSATKTHCGWKGEASYYNVVAGGDENKDAAWFYAEPKDAAKNIAGYVAFWKGVKVSK